MKPMSAHADWGGVISTRTKTHSPGPLTCESRHPSLSNARIPRYPSGCCCGSVQVRRCSGSTAADAERTDTSGPISLASRRADHAFLTAFSSASCFEDTRPDTNWPWRGLSTGINKDPTKLPGDFSSHVKTDVIAERGVYVSRGKDFRYSRIS